MAHGNKLTTQEIIHAFDAGGAVWSTVKEAVEIDRAYVAAHKNLSSEMLSYCRTACVYWAGMAEGIRQERERRNRRCEIIVDVPLDVCKRISNKIKQL